MFVIISWVFLLYVGYRLYQHLFPSPDINSHGKYVLISGCDTGFGHRLSIELDKQGFNVLAGVYNPINKDSLTGQLSSRATIFCLDITKQEDIDAAYNLVKDKTSVLHALVNNAGIGNGGLIDWTTVQFMRNIMDVNFFGHVAMTKKFLPLLISKRDSRVVNICSVAGFLTAPGMSAYSASKYALESFSDCLRREMAVWNLRVSIIEPSFMRTPMTENIDGLLQDLWYRLPIDVKQRWGEAYWQDQLKNIMNNPLLRYAEDPNKVVQVLRHAVVNTTPHIRYRPGWQSSILFFPLSMAPAWFFDLFLKIANPSRVLPAGVNQQLKQ